MMTRLTMQTSMAVAVLVCATGVAGAQEKPRIVAVNHALQFMAERLSGDTAEVEFLVPDGVDPSFWRPSIADISAVQSADMILLNGAGFATWTTKVTLPRSKTVNTSRDLEDQLIATQTITHSHGDGGEHSHDGTATYTWLDPDMAIAQAQVVTQAIKTKGWDDDASIDARFEALRAEFSAADADAQAALGGVSDTVFVATHPRYQYLARAYGLTILSLEWEAGAMPTDAQVADLRSLMADRGASVLIWEAAPPAQARALVSEMGLQDTVFPPLARADGDVPFLTVFSRAIQDLADAATRAGQG